MKAIIDGKRVTCEHCGSNDCAGISDDGARVICCLTGREIRGASKRLDKKGTR